MNRIRTRSVQILFTALVGLFLCVPAFADDSTSREEALSLQDVSMELWLAGAVFQREEPGKADPTLLLDIRKEDGVWQRVWGLAADFNTNLHHGIVREVVHADGRVTLRLLMNMSGDVWVPGGWGEYEVTLQPQGNRRYSGTFEGMFRGVAVTGEAHGRVEPPAPERVRAPAVAAGEHPRLLFRAEDLPALREKAKTPFGKALLEQMTNAAGLAFRYQITGDTAYADDARELVEKHMEDRDTGSKIVRSRVWGWRAEQVALAYDMCYDAWPEAFRRRVEENLANRARENFYSKRTFHSELNWHITSAYTGIIYYGASMAGLAILGEPGSEPGEPSAPFAIEHADDPIPPAGDYTPPGGVPVVDFEDGVMPTAWIYAGGFPSRHGALREQGGGEAFRPVPGLTLTDGDWSDTVRELSHEKDKGYHSGMIDITNATDRRFNTFSWFYTVIRNDKTRWVRANANHGGAHIYLNGRPLGTSSYVQIEPGLYPFLVGTHAGETTRWGRIRMRPILEEITEQEARSRIDSARTHHAFQRELWAFDHAQWERRGGANVFATRMFEVGRFLMTLYAREAVGEGGWQHGTTSGATRRFTPLSMNGPHKYALTYRNVMGRPLTSADDFSHFLPAHMFTHRYAPKPPVGEDDPVALRFGTVGFRTWEYIEPNVEKTNELFAPLFLQVPPAWQPAVLWAWRRHAGIDRDNDHMRVLHMGGRPYSLADYSTLPIYVFLAYSPDAEAEYPSALPLVWAAPTHGRYGFRNAWKDTDDVVLQVYAKGGSEAGTFRLSGFGKEWAHLEWGPYAGRDTESVVTLPGESVALSAGHMVDVDQQEDGSGQVVIDYDELYARPVLVEDGSGTWEDVYERYGVRVRPGSLAPSGITGGRAIAVDYSGKAGAPVLMVIADRIDGAAAPVWQWVLEASGESKRVGGLDEQEGMFYFGNHPPVPFAHGAFLLQTVEEATSEDVKIDGSSFTITQGDARLRGTLVTATSAEPAHQTRTTTRIRNSGLVHERTARGIFLDGAVGDTLCIVTLGTGEPPAVEVLGEGDGKTVRVGGRTIRFDGERIHIE